MMTEREHDPEPRKVQETPGKAEVNPAARRDPPAAGSGRRGEREPAEEAQVPPAQEEPLDPLGPGGIGS